jgi:hypothetical protein
MTRHCFRAFHSWPTVSRLTAAALIGAGALASGANAQAAAADFYKGKRVSIYVGNHPGGGYDAYTRLLARNIGRYIPGKPGTVVRNMPGAAGIRLANYLYNSAKKDGTEIGVFASSSAFAPLFGVKKAKFKIEKFTWIGNIDQTTGTCTAWHTSGFKTFDDLLKKPIHHLRRDRAHRRQLGTSQGLQRPAWRQDQGHPRLSRFDRCAVGHEARRSPRRLRFCAVVPEGAPAARMEVRQAGGPGPDRH